MELLFVLLLGAVLVLFVQLAGLRQRVAELEAERAPQIQVEHISAAPALAAAEPAAEEPLVPSAAELQPEPAAAPRETLGAVFERWVAGRLLVWLGGIALVLAAIFLIRYSIEIGLVTPALRMLGAAALGFVCVAASELARSRFRDDQRFAQALAGAGLAILYATAYGSHSLYALIGSATASAAMIAVTLAALAMSLRHGAPTAVMGLVGGFLTPLLVGNPNAGAVPLLAYLALLDVAIFALAWRGGWTWLAAAATLLSFVWTGYLLSRPPDDALAAGLFIVIVAIAASLARPGAGRELRLIQPLAIAAVELALLVARTDLGFAAWLLYAMLAASSLALAVLRPEYRPAPPAALALALVLLFARTALRVDPWAPEAAAGITFLFGFGGLGLAARRPRLLWSGTAAAGLAFPLLILRGAQPELLERPAWGAAAAGLALVAADLIWLNRGKARDEAPADPSLLAAGGAAMLLGGAALYDLLPPDWVTAGWLALALAVALAARRLGDLALATVAVLTAAAGVARALWLLPQLSSALIQALLGVPVLAADLPGALPALFELALPAVLLVALRLVLPPLPLGARRALPAVAGLFVCVTLYVWFKQAFGLHDAADFVARGLLERTIVTQALFAAGWLLASGRLRPPRMAPDTARLGGTALTVLAMARLVWFDMLLFDPARQDQWVGTLPVLNLILPAFLLSAWWLYAARKRAAGKPQSGLWLALCLAALIGGVALLVRQAFQGAILTGPAMPTAEFYTYSLAGILVAIALIVAGMRLPDKALRLAGLILLTATICKVFLVDAAELRGVLRILSFLGLGIALIGIGRLYGPVLRAESITEPA
jgi:uncharacterized membrane protein